MQNIFGIIAALYGMLAVILGAFGAHALKDKLDTYQHAIYEKAVSYQFYHIVALFVVTYLYTQTTSKWLTYSGWFFTMGILFFSGSLYLLAMRDILGINSITPILGPITPLGGLLLIIGWALLLVYMSKL